MQGFEPIYTKDSEILILGSFPSVKSREINFYYGNKQNRFWKVLSDIFNEDFNVSISQKIELLNKHKIAIWDIVNNSEIKGSSDSTLLKTVKKEDLNDIDNLIKNTNIKKVLCNGKLSYNLSKKVITSDVDIVYVPSTSPACVNFNYNLWEKEFNKK